MTEKHKPDQGIMWSLSHFHHLRLMRARYVQHSFKPHVHEYYVFGIVEAGVQSFSYKRGDLLYTTPGTLIIINPDEMHTGESAIQNGFQYRALYPTTSMLDAIAQDAHIKRTSPLIFKGGTLRDIQLFQQFQYLHNLSQQPVTPLELETGWLSFFTLLMHRYGIESGNIPHYQAAHPAVYQVRDYLEANYAQSISLTDLSKLVNMSRFHLARLFQKHIGLPPHRYLENVRIRHAEQLLIQGTPIAETAFATGFSSQAHLTRTFKQCIGTTPGEFRQQSKIV